MRVPREAGLGHAQPMRDWALNYVLHVLEEKNWSMNQLAEEAGVSASTINRPLREKDWPHSLSRRTIDKIHKASGIDPAPFAPSGMAAPPEPFTSAGRALARLDQDDTTEAVQDEIRIAVVGNRAQIVATIDRAGLDRLRRKLDAIEAMLDD